MAECSAVVATFRERHTAELARGFLEDADLAAVVAVDDAGGSLAGLTLSGGAARVLVRPEDVTRAREVLAEAGMLTEEAGGGDSEG